MRKDLKSAMPDAGFRPPDLEQIMADGGRIRWRRRIAFVVVVALLGGTRTVRAVALPDGQRRRADR